MLKRFLYISFIMLLALYMSPTWPLLSGNRNGRGGARKIFDEFSCTNPFILYKIYLRAPP